MQATRLVFALLFGALLIGVCMAKPSKKALKLQQTRQGFPCSSGDYVCNDGTCIFSFWECDGIDDCSGGEDEANCPSASAGCSSYDFTCNDGSCIPGYWQCDTWDDCSGGEDEAGCPCDGYTCNDGDCIPSNWECDGWDDCDGGEDEANCPCGSYEYTCNDGDCIPDYWECDYIVDCDGGEDEANCPTSTPYFSSDFFSNTCDYNMGEFPCLYSDECVTFDDMCDGETDCSGGEDESDMICCMYGDSAKRAPKKRWEKMTRKVEQKKRAMRK
ncbi:very low-density lipoprotein receptor-like [Patiria miniata]|uniref:Uncharacterized protein n=1 Tax=Patiria miniata TaxID=46514 RepID=A0A913ZQF2_PATMI|nr:very low-density lipoprotein receptor-like [Patiria miniata]